MKLKYEKPTMDEYNTTDDVITTSFPGLLPGEDGTEEDRKW